MIAERVRQRVAGEPLKLAAKIREVAQADRPEAARSGRSRAPVGDACVFGSIAQQEIDDAFVGGVSVRERRRPERTGAEARAQAPPAGRWGRGRVVLVGGRRLPSPNIRVHTRTLRQS